MRFRGTESQMKNRRSISDIILKDSEFSGILLTNQDNSSKFIQEEKYTQFARWRKFLLIS